MERGVYRSCSLELSQFIDLLPQKVNLRYREPNRDISATVWPFVEGRNQLSCKSIPQYATLSNMHKGRWNCLYHLGYWEATIESTKWCPNKRRSEFTRAGLPRTRTDDNVPCSFCLLYWVMYSIYRPWNGASQDGVWTALQWGLFPGGSCENSLGGAVRCAGATNSTANNLPSAS